MSGKSRSTGSPAPSRTASFGTTGSPVYRYSFDASSILSNLFTPVEVTCIGDFFTFSVTSKGALLVKNFVLLPSHSTVSV